MVKGLLKLLIGIHDNEINLLLKKGALYLNISADSETIKSNLDKDFYCSVDYVDNKASWKIKEGFLNFFRQDIIELTSSKLVGMELKRGCQYEREWISGISLNNKNEIIITNNKGVAYNADNVSVYETETKTTPIYNFAASLLIESVVGGDGECSICIT